MGGAHAVVCKQNRNSWTCLFVDPFGGLDLVRAGTGRDKTKTTATGATECLFGMEWISMTRQLRNFRVQISRLKRALGDSLPADSGVFWQRWPATRLLPGAAVIRDLQHPTHSWRGPIRDQLRASHCILEHVYWPSKL